LAAVSALASVAMAQAPVAPADWPYYSRDLAGTRFSPLTQIDTRNVSRLARVWSVPVVRGHEVLALDAATGQEISHLRQAGWRPAEAQRVSAV
jgi:glucose dehydrogenase